MKLIDLEKRLDSMEKELTLFCNRKDYVQSCDILAYMQGIQSRLETLEKTETGRIRYEVQQMFKTVMTERDLLQWRIPFWATKIIKLKNRI